MVSGIDKCRQKLLCQSTFLRSLNPQPHIHLSNFPFPRLPPCVSRSAPIDFSTGLTYLVPGQELIFFAPAGHRFTEPHDKVAHSTRMYGLISCAVLSADALGVAFAQPCCAGHVWTPLTAGHSAIGVQPDRLCRSSCGVAAGPRSMH